MPPAIAIQNVSYKYGERQALRDISLTAEEGSVTALLGPNGSGKTTLLQIVATILPLQVGAVALAGAPLYQDILASRRRLGIVYQTSTLDHRLTIYENLRHRGHMYGLWGADLRDRIGAALASTALLDRRNDRVRTLSGGMQRRADVAAGILHQPSLLLLDEPTTGLDPAARADFWSLIRRLQKEHNTTLLFTTHLTEEAQESDRVGILDEGRLMALDAPATLKSQMKAEVIVIRSQRMGRVREMLQKKFGLEPRIVGDAARIETDSSATVLPGIAAELNGIVDSITIARTGLDDLFFSLTGREFRE